MRALRNFLLLALMACSGQRAVAIFTEYSNAANDSQIKDEDFTDYNFNIRTKDAVNREAYLTTETLVCLVETIAMVWEENVRDFLSRVQGGETELDVTQIDGVLSKLLATDIGHIKYVKHVAQDRHVNLTITENGPELSVWDIEDEYEDENNRSGETRRQLLTDSEKMVKKLRRRRKRQRERLRRARTWVAPMRIREDCGFSCPRDDHDEGRRHLTREERLLRREYEAWMNDSLFTELKESCREEGEKLFTSKLKVVRLPLCADGSTKC